jgi:hypothetical protein
VRDDGETALRSLSIIWLASAQRSCGTMRGTGTKYRARALLPGTGSRLVPDQRRASWADPLYTTL